ncbi:MAG: SDR family NAD(P)-dependent oxidoreductase [Burkholderiales bacterium]|nr:SDR family oxidoreductase [Nitrosomonadaceae bacterium]
MNDATSPSGVLLVTGAAGGLGQAVVALTMREAPETRIAAVGRDADKLRAAFGDAHLQIVADVGEAEGAAHAVERCTAELGVPTQFAHCVGSIVLGPVARVNPAQYREAMRANLDSAFFMLSALSGAAKKHNTAMSMCFVSTIAAQVGIANHEVIAAAKGGLEAMVRSAAASHAAQGIRINAVAPGLMDTPAAARFLSSDALRDASAKQYPLGSIGTPDELAGLIVWLLSDAAKRVTGQIWTVDGGFTSIRPVVR